METDSRIEIDPNKVIEALNKQLSQSTLQNALLTAQLETLVEAYNRLKASKETSIEESS